LQCWISVRVDTFGALFSAALAAYMIYRPGTDGDAAQAGFSINMAGKLFFFVLRSQQ
jgi:hypothetical protein